MRDPINTGQRFTFAGNGKKNQLTFATTELIFLTDARLSFSVKEYRFGTINKPVTEGTVDGATRDVALSLPTGFV